jgi:hypothetical protein
VGHELTAPRRYRRTPEAEPREPPGRLPGGRRLVVVIVGLAVLVVLTVAIVVLGGDDSDDDAADPAAPTSTSVPASATSTPPTLGRAPDVVVARQVLPATLGPGWVEVSRDPEPVPAAIDETDACAAAGQPIQDGLVTRVSFDRLGTQDIVERAALVGGVVTEGATVPSLDDAVVVDCLQQGLQAQVAEGNEVVAVDQPDLPPAPVGASLSGARFEVHEPDGDVPGRFDLLLLQRDRAVVFVLIAVLDPDSATPLADVVAALDAPLALAAPRLN